MGGEGESFQKAPWKKKIAGRMVSLMQLAMVILL